MFNPLVFSKQQNEWISLVWIVNSMYYIYAIYLCIGFGFIYFTFRTGVLLKKVSIFFLSRFYQFLFGTMFCVSVRMIARCVVLFWKNLWHSTKVARSHSIYWCNHLLQVLVFWSFHLPLVIQFFFPLNKMYAESIGLD